MIDRTNRVGDHPRQLSRSSIASLMLAAVGAAGPLRALPRLDPSRQSAVAQFAGHHIQLNQQPPIDGQD